ncbi:MULTISPECIES: DUF4395 domain-containing protein [unclassified Sutcliffiella]|uniref:DUF4395 domain-containing protein n=1 Tax=unclassified Sutcliffiella TaxID=2837532 RepID=UPI0030D0A8CB
MKNSTLPKPLVTFNQWFILTSVILSLASGLYFLMALPLVSGLMGLLFKWNPALTVARKFLTKPAESYLQEDVAQLQFNQTIAVTCLALALVGFYSGFTIVGYIFAIMVGVASGVALMGFCVGCFIRFQWQQYRYRRTN